MPRCRHKREYLSENRVCRDCTEAERAEEKERFTSILQTVQEDIQWMLNNQKFLNSWVFDYLDDAIKGDFESKRILCLLERQRRNKPKEAPAEAPAQAPTPPAEDPT